MPDPDDDLAGLCERMVQAVFELEVQQTIDALPTRRKPPRTSEEMRGGL